MNAKKRLYANAQRAALEAAEAEAKQAQEAQAQASAFGAASEEKTAAETVSSDVHCLGIA